MAQLNKKIMALPWQWFFACWPLFGRMSVKLMF